MRASRVHVPGVRALAAVILAGTLAACDDGILDLMTEAEVLRGANEITAALEGATEAGLVTAVDTTGAVVTFFVEGDITVMAALDLFETVAADRNRWRLDISFASDAGSLSLPHVGDALTVTAVSHPNADIFPLVQPLEVELPWPGRLSYTVRGRSGPGGDVRSPTRDAAGTTRLDVVGLYPGRSNVVEIEYGSPNGEDRLTMVIELDRDAIPDLPTIDVLQLDSSHAEARLFLTAHRFDHRPLVVDQFGDVRWYADLTAQYAIQQAKDGTLLFTDQEQVFNVSLEGEVLRTYGVPSPYSAIHHDVFEMSNGDLVLTVNNDELDTIEDVVIVLDRRLGTLKHSWDLNESIPRNYELIRDTVDWLHINAITIDERDMSLLLSGQRRGVYKVSWENDLVWILADSTGFAADAPLLDFDGGGVWGQHDIRVDEQTGDHYLFDNGLGRNYSNSQEFSRGLRFSVDEASMTASVQSEYRPASPSYFAPIISGIDYLGDRVLLNFGSLGYNFDYQGPDDFRGPDPIIRPDADFGAAWVEYDGAGMVTQHMTFSKELASGLDPGMYRARYVDLFGRWR